MAYSSFPFDNQNSTETQFSKLFREAVDSGVVDDLDLRITANGSGMVVFIAAGTAFARGHCFVNDAAATLTIEPAGTSARTDLVVLRLDPNANTIVPAIVKGTPGSGAPALTQTDVGVFELPLAQILVNANVVTLTAETVTDLRRRSGTRTGTWVDDSRRPSTPRLGRLGFNISRGYWEGWDGNGWQYAFGPFKRVWTYRRGTTFTDSDAYGPATTFTFLGEVALPASAPAGTYRVSAQMALYGVNGRTGRGNLRISSGPSGLETNRNYDERLDVMASLVTQTKVCYFDHPGGAVKVRMAHKTNVATGVDNTGTVLEVQYVGPGAL